MGRPSSGGHIRKFPRHKTYYRLISVKVDGVRRQRLEHRLVMEKYIGRRLRKNEIVHHKDENGLNNDINNLEILSQSHHVKHHRFGQIKWDIKSAILMRNDGRAISYIAKEMNVSPATIRMAFKRRGLSTSDLRWGKNKWDVCKAIELFNIGTKLSEIARQVGVTSSSVKKAFIKRKII